jgi:hypothetical protein
VTLVERFPTFRRKVVFLKGKQRPIKRHNCENLKHHTALPTASHDDAKGAGALLQLMPSLTFALDVASGQRDALAT